jgi:hypothetical protein
MRHLTISLRAASGEAWAEIGCRLSPVAEISAATISTTMTKHQRPFTFEVKRSRLSSPKTSAFQRYVVAPDPVVEAQTTPSQSWRSVTDPGEAAPRPSAARILPSLSGGEVWAEEPIAIIPAEPAPVELIELPEEPVAEMSSPAEDVIEPAPDQPTPELKRSRSIRRRRTAPDDLPRGQRWKRRLPRAAW